MLEEKKKYLGDDLVGRFVRPESGKNPLAMTKHFRLHAHAMTHI